MTHTTEPAKDQVPALPPTWLPDLKAKLFSAVRETSMAAEFADQVREAMEFGAFHPATDSELDSAESALLTAHSLLDEASEMLDAVRRESGVRA